MALIWVNLGKTAGASPSNIPARQSSQQGA
jgi:hypothetical protein